MPAALAICRMITTFLQAYPILNVIRMFANLLKFLKKSRASRSCQERFLRRLILHGKTRVNRASEGKQRVSESRFSRENTV